MGCGIYKSSKTFLNKIDLIELQKHTEELNEKRIKILKWMEDNLEFQIKLNDNHKINWKNIKENQQLLSWQEEWKREQQLVNHPSMVDLCESKISCITLIDENLQLLCKDIDVMNYENETKLN